MDSQRRQQIERIYHAALDRPSNQRAAFLDGACGEDCDLRREVESRFAQAPTETVVDGAVAAGTMLGPYRVEAPLGAGGMGVVYRAIDTRLNRPVAVKFLFADLADTTARRRFQTEAQTASSLNHPHILTVLDVGEHEGRQYLVTEFVDGGTLRRWKQDTQPGWPQIAELMAGVADGLACAHEAGILHRDVKPDNVLVSRNGYAKLADFGLAKLMEPNSGGPETRTATEMRTRPGTVLGTIAYMSPEQASGRPVDARSDIFSLGVVLYELLAGRRPFDGATDLETLQSVIHRPLEPLGKLRPDLPVGLRVAIEKALEKDPPDRYQSARELVVDLRREARQGVTAPVRPRWLTMAAIAGAILLLVAAIVLVVFRSGPAKAPPSATFAQVTDLPGEEYFPSLAPDGKSVVYQSQASGRWDIYLQRVGGGSPINLTKDSGVHNVTPAFSPDGELIAFASYRSAPEARVGLYLMGATGESVRRLSDLCFHPSWSPDGREIVCSTELIERPQARAPTSRLWRIEVATGRKRTIGSSDGIQPDWSPHNLRVAFAAGLGGQRDVWTMPIDGGEAVPVTQDQPVDWSPRWAPDGKHLYFASDRGGSMNLWRVAIDEKTGRTLGEPHPVTTPARYLEHISLSRDGTRMAYADQTQDVQIYKVAFDSLTETVQGTPIPITRGSKPHWFPDPSPDGKSLTFCSMQKPEDIFVIGTDGMGLRQLTNDSFMDRFPRWSPDNRRIAFMSDRSGRPEIWLINADGGDMRRLTYTDGTGDTVVAGAVWSPDGKRIAYNRADKDPCIIEVDTPWKDQQPVPIPTQKRWVRTWSPDGRRLGLLIGPKAFVYDFDTGTSTELGRGGQPVWLRDSRRMVMESGSNLELVDTITRRSKVLLSVAPKHVEGRLSISPDNRTIYFTASSTEADIWLATWK